MAQTKQEKSIQRQVHEQALDALNQLGGQAFAEEDIIFKGTKMVLPEKMTLSEAVEFLEEKAEEWENVATFAHTFRYKPWDVAWCAQNALKRVFGSIGHNHSIAMTFFGPQKRPPVLLTIPTGPDTTEQIPWGVLELPFLPNTTFNLTATETEDGVVGQIVAEGPKKYRHAVNGVFLLIEEELKERSLYRGKAFDAQEKPQFLDLSKIDPEKIIYSNDIETQLDANVWTPLRHREKIAEMGLSFKRAVLFAGDFGTGKSLAINRTGQIAEQCGITFILARPGRDDLREALLTARMYQPAIVAFEDVDTVADTDPDAKHVSEILDLFDGIEAKNSDVMLVLTTNHIDKLHKGMLRPGRLDAVIDITAPDADGIVRMIKANMPKETLADEIEWDSVTDAMVGYLPAFVVESCQRAIRYQLARTNGEGGEKVETNDLVAAAMGLRPQYQMMADAKAEPERNRLDDALGHLVRQAIEGMQVKDLNEEWTAEVTTAD